MATGNFVPCELVLSLSEITWIVHDLRFWKKHDNFELSI